MQIGARRKLDMALLGGGVLVTAAACAIAAYAGDAERISSFWAGAELHTDGTAAVTEVIDWNFGNAQGKHGIFRDVKDLSPSSRIEVSSPDAPADLVVLDTPSDSPSFPATRLRIGDPDETVSGERRYVIGYDLDTLLRQGQLGWDAVGAGAWPVTIDKATINVVAPWTFTNPQCFEGATGSTDTCTITQVEPGRLVVTTGALDPGTGVTVSAGQGASLPATPALDVPTGAPPGAGGTGIALPAAIGAVGALVAAAPASFLVRRRGRERVGVGGAADAAYTDGQSERLVDSAALAELATIEFAPPRELTPPEGGIVLAESVRSEHKVAWLMDEAIAGSLDVDDSSSPVVLRRREFGDPSAAPVLNQMFDGRDEIELGRYDKDFATGWRQLSNDLQEWADTSGLWDPAGDRRRNVVRVLGIVAAVVGLAVAALCAWVGATRGSGWLIGVGIGALLAGAGVACAVRAWELRVRTPKGSGLWLRVESFRRFLAASEARHVEEAARRGVLREYTAWAVAVGEVDRWRHAMEAASNIPNVDVGNALAFAYIASSLSSATSSASTPPSSSGGGGGSFGGSVGGGGGGGGGGSW
jgi:Predicted membrane protein (DUF2207) C-terminal domain/Predicted membrane protein (DUF2207) N-terminal domain